MDSEPFGNIEYTPAWYYKHFPGFYNIECYNILADYSNHPEKYVTDDGGVEEEKTDEPCDNSAEDDNETDERVNKKLKISNET